MSKFSIMICVMISSSMLFPSDKKSGQFYSPNIKPQPGKFSSIATTKLIHCNSCGATFTNNSYHSCPIDKRYWKK